MGMMMVQEEMITITIFVIYSIGRSFVITYATSAWMSQFFLQSSFALHMCAVLNYLHPFTRNKNLNLKLKQMHTDADFNNNRVCNKGFLHFIQNVIIG